MKNLIPYILSALCLLSCIKDKQTGADLAIGDPIPDFNVTMNGGTVVTGEDLRQGISCIVFFTTECPDCMKTLPHVQKIYDEYLAKGVKFALISRAEGEERVSRYWASEGLTMPYSAQQDRKIYELFAQAGVPRVYLCKDGIIKNIFTDQPENPTYGFIKEALERLF